MRHVGLGMAAWVGLTLALSVSFHSAAAAPATVAAIGKTVEWDAKKDGAPKTYAVGGLQITLSGARSQGPKGGDGPPVLTIASPRFGPARIVGATGFDLLTASFFVPRLDPKADGPAVVLMSWTGGAHCCLKTDILDPIAGRWVHVDGGSWDGDATAPPKDIDGDGAPDFVRSDDAFLYAFACYACAGAPPKVFNVIGGAWRDVTTSPKYAPVFRKDAAEAKANCKGGDGGGQNGYCAEFVADAARLGEFDRAWRYMLAHYDHDKSWGLPTGCDVARVRYLCPKGHEIEFKTYPEALRNFLQEHGYIPKA